MRNAAEGVIRIIVVHVEVAFLLASILYRSSNGLWS